MGTGNSPDLPGEVGPASFYVAKHPQRKRAMLARSKGSVYRPIAYFLDEEYAREFMAFMDLMAKASVPDFELSDEYHGWSLRDVR